MATGRNNPKDNPKTTQVVANMLKEMGITEYEPRLLNHLTEYAHRYTTEVLKDASAYSKYAKKKVIDEEDVSLAIKMKEMGFTTPPSKDLNTEIAKAKNAAPLPVPKSSVGPRLPADRYAVTSTNYRMKSVAKKKVVANAPRLTVVGPNTITIGPKKGTPLSFLRTTQPASSKPGAPTSSKPGIPASSKPGIPASSKPGIPASSKAAALPILPVPRPFVTIAKPAIASSTSGSPTTSAPMCVSFPSSILSVNIPSKKPVDDPVTTDTRSSSEVPNEAQPVVSED